ncbi:MAG: hypothetical protein ACTSRS_03990 [Candidatus Helarchaeota archaeon]
MTLLDDVRKTASALEKENLRGAYHIVMQALSQLHRFVQNVAWENLIAGLQESCYLLFKAQPTMAPLANCMALVLDELDRNLEASRSLQEIRYNLLIKIQDLMKEYQTSLKKIIINASALIPDQALIMVYSFSTTVFETIKFQKILGKRLEIVITEARPNNEGQIGAQQFSKLYPTMLFIDAAIGHILEKIPINLILIGADAFTDTELIHKIGTLPLALTAQYFKVPIYSLTHSLKYYQGDRFHYPIPIEYKPPSEITPLEELENLEIRNLYFDRTPLELLTGLVTDKGIYEFDKDEFPKKEVYPFTQLKKLYEQLKEEKAGVAIL